MHYAFVMSCELTMTSQEEKDFTEYTDANIKSKFVISESFILKYSLINLEMCTLTS